MSTPAISVEPIVTIDNRDVISRIEINGELVYIYNNVDDNSPSYYADVHDAIDHATADATFFFFHPERSSLRFQSTARQKKFLTNIIRVMPPALPNRSKPGCENVVCNACMSGIEH